MTAWVLEGNARAQRFYEAAGMRLDGGRKVEVEEGADLDYVRHALRTRGAGGVDDGAPPGRLRSSGAP